MDDGYIQRKNFPNSFEVHFADLQAQLTASRLDCKTSRAANDDVTKNRDADRKELSTLRAWIFELKAGPEASRAYPFDDATAIRDWARYKVWLQSLAAQGQELQAGNTYSGSRSQSSQASICDVLSLLLKAFHAPFSS